MAGGRGIGGKRLTPLEEEIYSIAAYFGEWDVEGDLSGNGFLDRISWRQLSKWLEFRRQHPIGEERDDLRIGALGSILWNCNIDTRNGKDVKADKYIVGWGEERKHVFRLSSERIDQDKVGRGGSNGGNNDQSLNNPAVWADFKANIKAAAKGKGIGSG